MDCLSYGCLDVRRHWACTSRLSMTSAFLGGSVFVTMYWDETTVSVYCMCEDRHRNILYEMIFRFAWLKVIVTCSISWSKNIAEAVALISYKAWHLSSDTSLYKKNLNAVTALPRLPRGLPVPVLEATDCHWFTCCLSMKYGNTKSYHRVFKVTPACLSNVLHIQKEVIIGKKREWCDEPV